MRSANKKIYILYTLIIGIIFYNIFFARYNIDIYNTIINPLLWIIVFLVSIFYVNEIRKRDKHNKDKIEIVSIIMLFYFIIYFLLGLVFTYSKSIYGQDILTMFKNVWSFISIIIFKEYVRTRIVDNAGGSKFHLITTTLLFILADISFYNLSAYTSSSEIFFKYSFQTLCPIIFLNIICTYLSTVCNCVAGIIYRGIMVLIKIIPPIQPAFDWFMYGMFESVLPVILFAVVSYYHTKKTSRDRRKSIRKSNPIPRLVLIAILIIFGFFVGGFFKYMPTAVMSGSMDPIFMRGDAVIIEKIDENNFKKLKINDIIAYRLEDRIVLHRIIEIEDKFDEVQIITKGDNNDYRDNKIVTQDMVIGIIRFRVKYIGYPSVLLYDYFAK